MAKSKSTRTTRKARQQKMAKIAEGAFSAAFRKALKHSALVNPNGTLRTTVEEYLGAMRAHLEWMESKEAKRRTVLAVRS